MNTLYVGMVPTRPLSLNKYNGPELLNAVVTSLFRHTTCSMSVFIHGKTFKGGGKGGKMRSYKDTWKIAKPSISSSFSSSNGLL